MSNTTEALSIRSVRLAKVQRLRDLGHDPYANERFDATHSILELLSGFDHIVGEVSLAGRVVSYRLMGKAGFAHLSDGDHRFQAYFKKDDVGEVGWELYNLLDLGDHIGVKGELFVTKTGEMTIHVRTLAVLSKALQALPLGKEKEGHVFSGLSDIEQRYRHRHLDLLANPESREKLLTRSKIVKSVREYLDRAGFLEVETPILQFEAGGAAATPFKTRYNAYEADVKLRISLELYLKRILCGDVPKVYELGRVFRNEGVSNRHNPEFTMLEFYEAYTDLEGMMNRVEELFRFVASALDATGDRSRIQSVASPDFSKPWKRVSLLKEIERHSGIAPRELEHLDTALGAARINEVEQKALEAGGKIDLSAENSLGAFIEKLLEVFVEPTLIEPTFVVGYPIETSPLAKKDPSNPRMTRRFEGYVLGREICNAFSEINDPVDQRERFESQLHRRAAGDEEAHPMDEEFIYALECGMPPCGGCGIGIDRLVMLLTGAEHVREILMFPTMRPERNLDREPPIS